MGSRIWRPCFVRSTSSHTMPRSASMIPMLKMAGCLTSVAESILPFTQGQEVAQQFNAVQHPAITDSIVLHIVEPLVYTHRLEKNTLSNYLHLKHPLRGSIRVFLVPQKDLVCCHVFSLGLEPQLTATSPAHNKSHSGPLSLAQSRHSHLGSTHLRCHPGGYTAHWLRSGSASGRPGASAS